jgi:hypothetical protein
VTRCAGTRWTASRSLLPHLRALLDALPLTANGKVDRGALPDPGGIARSRPGHCPPDTPAERALAAIWIEVLGGERVGRDDDFFATGGDSILSIQVVARAARAGLSSPRSWFSTTPSSPTQAAAGDSGAALRADAEQGPVTGEVPPLPVHRWFLGQGQPVPGQMYGRAGFHLLRHRILLG